MGATETIGYTRNDIFVAAGCKPYYLNRSRCVVTISIGS